MKPANPYPPYLQASNIGKATVGVQKEMRGTMGATTTAPKQYTEAEKNACSLEAMLNGGTCEARQ
jgi:ribonucleoside-diphosphate reductase alpha chain